MSTDENHRQAHMTLTAGKICGVFATSLNFNLPTYFISHYCCRRDAVFHRRDFLKEKESRAV